MKVKICGISNEIDALKAIELGADAIGFVMGGRVLPVEVEPYAQWVRQTIKKFPQNVTAYLVTHLENAEDILDLAKYIKATGIQISEDSSVKEVKKIRKAFDGKIIKTIVSNDEQAFEKQKLYQPYIDYFLLDSRTAGYTGGTGAENDWNKSKALIEATSIPTFIAGGLNPQNVKHAIQICNPYGVDVSTGISCFSESYLKKDRKDHQKIETFINFSKEY